MYKKIALAINFSPSCNSLFNEAVRLTNLFGASLILIHAGKKSEVSQLKFNELIESSQTIFEPEIFWGEGDPAQFIVNTAEKQNVDLLIAGALEKETLIKFYIGSVARFIMREFNNSVLILKNASLGINGYNKFIASTDFSSNSELAIKQAYRFALLENAKEFIIVRDYYVPGIASSVLDSGSTSTLDVNKEIWQLEEENKMKIFIKELNFTEMKVKAFCIYGKEGHQSAQFARENNADLFCLNVPAKKLKFWDRIFMHEAEFSFQQLPSNLLIIR